MGSSTDEEMQTLIDSVEELRKFLQIEKNEDDDKDIDTIFAEIHNLRNIDASASCLSSSEALNLDDLLREAESLLEQPNFNTNGHQNGLVANGAKMVKVSKRKSKCKKKQNLVEDEPNEIQKIEECRNKQTMTENDECTELRLQHKQMEDQIGHLQLQLDAVRGLQEESENAKLEISHLNEMCSMLRNELSSVRAERDETLQLKMTLQAQLDDATLAKKKFQETIDKNSLTIRDLQRQNKEIERIMLRKHPDSVSSLIIASKESLPAKNKSESTRQILENRIAQLETDAKQQDLKAQSILTNVQSKFNAVHETHIADLETQVLNLQAINAELNEKIVQREGEIQGLYLKANTDTNSNATQTSYDLNGDAFNTVSTQTELKLACNLRSSASSSGIKRSGIPNSISESNIHGRDDAHLLATIRGMRVDLAIKEKSIQRLNKEIEEHKKTVRKLQKERSTYLVKMESSKKYDPMLYTTKVSEQDSLSRIQSLESDCKFLHEKRLHDLQALQEVHDRELLSCHENIQFLKQKLNEKDQSSGRTTPDLNTLKNKQKIRPKNYLKGLTKKSEFRIATKSDLKLKINTNS